MAKARSQNWVRSGVKCETGMLWGLCWGDQFLGMTQETQVQGGVEKNTQGPVNPLEGSGMDEEIVHVNPRIQGRGARGVTGDHTVSTCRIT